MAKIEKEYYVPMISESIVLRVTITIMITTTRTVIASNSLGRDRVSRKNS